MSGEARGMDAIRTDLCDQQSNLDSVSGHHAVALTRQRTSGEVNNHF
jgi:hypothetical protein